MKKILLSMAIAVTALCGTAQTYHAITDGELVSCSQENIAATEWISYSTTSYYTSRNKCVTTGENIPNLSKSERYVSLNVSGCASFDVTADGNGERNLIIGVNGTTIETKLWENNCNTYSFQTGNTGDITITIAGDNGSVYLSSVTLYAPSQPILQRFAVGGEEMAIDNDAMTVTGTVSAETDLTTATPEVTIGGSATNYNFDGNYNGGTLTVTDGTVTITYTVTVTNRVADNTAPAVTGIYSGEVNLEDDFCPVNGTIRVAFDEPIRLVEGTDVTVSGAYINDTEGNTRYQCEGKVWVEDNNLYFEPATRLNSNFMYQISMSNAVADMEGNVYAASGATVFMTEEVPLTITNTTPEPDQYIHALRFTFSTPIERGTSNEIWLADANDPNVSSDNLYTTDNAEISGNNLYVLDVDKFPNGRVICAISFNFIRSIYYDATQIMTNTAFCYLDADEAGYTTGSNDFFIGFDAPINDTYLLPSWISGTANLKVDRGYAGTDMPAGAVGAIRGNKTDSLIVEVPQACSVNFSVSATGGRNFVIANEKGTTLASASATKNNLTAISADVNAPGKIYLSTPGATGGFTVQAITIGANSGTTGLNNINTDGIGVRYANNTIVTNGLTIEVYNTVGVRVARSADNIDMTAMPQGVYVIRTDNGSMKIVR